MSSSTAVVRAAGTSSSGDQAQPCTMPATTVFRKRVHGPDEPHGGWSLTPVRLLEAADYSLFWRSKGYPELQARIKAVDRVRSYEKGSPPGPFLSTFVVSSAMMTAGLLHEVLLVQNLVLQWTDEEETIATSAWPQDGPEASAPAAAAALAAAAVPAPAPVPVPTVAAAAVVPMFGYGSKPSRPSGKAPTPSSAVPKIKSAPNALGPKWLLKLQQQHVLCPPRKKRMKRMS